MIERDFEMVGGDTFRLRGTVYEEDGETIRDITDDDAIFVITKNEGSGPRLVEKTLSGGGIEKVDAVNGRLDVVITPKDTENLSGAFYHELKVTGPEGGSTGLMGRFQINESDT